MCETELSTACGPMDYTIHMSIRSLVTVVETPVFLARIDKLMTEGERELLIAYLAANPIAGDLIPGTGGVRKLRWLSLIHISEPHETRHDLVCRLLLEKK